MRGRKGEHRHYLTTACTARCLFYTSTASSPGLSLGAPRSSVASGAGLEPGAPRRKALAQDLRNGHLVISFVALSRNGFWFINLWLIFGHSGEKPRYGKNSRLLQDFPTGPRHVQLAWGSLGTGPRPKPLQRHVDILRAGGNEPHGTSGGQEQAKGIGAHNRLALATVVLGYPIIGMAVTDSNVYGPASFIGLQHGVGRPRHRGTEKGFKGLETPQRLAAVGRGRAVKVRPPDHHDP